MVNKKFEEQLAAYCIDPVVAELYKAIITEIYKGETGKGNSDLIVFKKQLAEYLLKVKKPGIYF